MADEMKPRVLLSAMLFVFLLLPGTARAELTIIGHYTGGDTTFDISTFSKDGGKAVIVGMSRKVSIAFSKNDWNSFVAVWRKAEQSQSDSFQFIGSYKETGTTYRSLLMVAAGPGVLFTINDAKGTLSFILLPKDFAAFNANIATAANYLNSN